MKIAIPTAEKSMDAHVGDVFGRSPVFLIYDIESKGHEFIENDALHRPGGAGVQAAQLLVDHKVDVVITPQCGEKAQEVLRRAEIRICRSIEGSLQHNLQACLNDKLTDLEGGKQ
ncbi:MAG: dinitrogenase iron-molybdenum cofactor biosynthesis protein [Firmicutes bacterium]|nr:dinitrogenase iron-molybdenum cofactor biosynthesis protein [Bacillota bacterium]